MFRFKVTSVALSKDVRGRSTVTIGFSALPSPGFGSDEMNAAPPEGAIAISVPTEIGRRFTLGDEFTVIFRERDVEEA